MNCVAAGAGGVGSILLVFLYLCQNPRVPFCYSVFVPIQNTTGVPEPPLPILLY